MILAGNDFETRPYRIQNQKDNLDFQNFIDNTEKELLIEILGYELTLDLLEQTKTSGMEERFEKLIDGDGKYPGLIETLRPGVYSKWLPANSYKLTAVGIVENTPTTGSTLVSLEEFEIISWNDYVERVGNDGCHKTPSNLPTFYSYMYANREDFPEWQFVKPLIKNRYWL